jgi:hypothetical protein
VFQNNIGICASCILKVTKALVGCLVISTYWTSRTHALFIAT